MILWKTNEYLGSMRIPPYSIGAMSVSLLLGCVTGPYAPVWKAEEAPAHNLVRLEQSNGCATAPA